MSKSDSSPLGKLPKDDTDQAVQIGNEFKTEDATSTPQTSPLSVSSSVITLVVPDRAVELIVYPTEDMRISENSDPTDGGGDAYDVIAGGSKESIPVAGMQNVYVLRDSVDVSLRFRFTIV